MKYRDGMPITIRLLDGSEYTGVINAEEDERYIYLRVFKDLRLFMKTNSSRTNVDYSEFTTDKLLVAKEYQFI